MGAADSRARPLPHPLTAAQSPSAKRAEGPDAAIKRLHTGGSMDRAQAIEAVWRTMAALLATIKEAGAEGVPEGPLYAALMSQGVTFAVYTAMVARLVQRGLISQRGHILCYVGP